ncbi:hypothetical protein [Streptomyces lydicus]|uniref:hypothetical protein n=1 Tax=Streptomyces lydicus TaxID=47763 RepID=UPI00379D1A9C
MRNPASGSQAREQLLAHVGDQVIDVAVLWLASPGVQGCRRPTPPGGRAREANDQLAEIVASQPAIE